MILAVFYHDQITRLVTQLPVVRHTTLVRRDGVVETGHHGGAWFLGVD